MDFAVRGRNIGIKAIGVVRRRGTLGRAAKRADVDGGPGDLIKGAGLVDTDVQVGPFTEEKDRFGGAHRKAGVVNSGRGRGYAAVSAGGPQLRGRGGDTREFYHSLGAHTRAAYRNI